MTIFFKVFEVPKLFLLILGRFAKFAEMKLFWIISSFSKSFGLLPRSTGSTHLAIKITWEVLNLNISKQFLEMEALIIELYYALFYQQSYPIHLDVRINRDNTAL